MSAPHPAIGLDQRGGVGRRRHDPRQPGPRPGPGPADLPDRHPQRTDRGRDHRRHRGPGRQRSAATPAASSMPWSTSPPAPPRPTTPGRQRRAQHPPAAPRPPSPDRSADVPHFPYPPHQPSRHDGDVVSERKTNEDHPREPEPAVQRQHGGERAGPGDRRRRIAGPARPVRLRQDQHDAMHRRAGTAQRRPDHHRRHRRPRLRTAGQRRPVQAQRRDGLPVLRRVAAPDRLRERRVLAEDEEGAEGGGHQAGPQGPRRGRACRTSKPAAPASSPVARCSASRWPAAWSCSPACCCSTSRCPTWTPGSGSGCASNSARSSST